MLRELVSMNPGVKPLTLARMCYPETTATEVRKSLDFMVHVGILEKRGEYEYEQVEKVISTSSEIMPLAIRSMHRQMAEFAHKAIDCVPGIERNFNGNVGKRKFVRY